MKKVLLITYHFPPDAAVGGLRAVKFARYLPEFGWDPYVLTVKDEYRERLAAGSLDEVQGMKVFKTRQTTTVDETYQRIKSVFGRGRGKGLARQGSPPCPATNGPLRESLFRKLKRTFIAMVVFMPDHQKSWIIPAYFEAARLIKKEGITHILTSGPPHSTHLLGLLIKKTMRVKWVADFRDPWTDVSHFEGDHVRCALGDRLEEMMESKVMRNADSVIVNTNAFKRILTKRYDGAQGNITCIPNGIYTEKIRESSGAEKFERFTITYAGTLYAGRSPEPVFKALRRLLDSGEIKAGAIRVKLIGNCNFIDDRTTKDVAASYGLDGVVEVVEPVPFFEAIKIMHRSQLLLLLAPGLPLQIPAKAYDYMGTGIPILSIAEKGSATTELIESTSAGRSFDPGETESIARFLIDSIRKDGFSTTGAVGAAWAESYDIRRLTGRLADELSRTSSPPHPEGQEVTGDL